MYSNYDWKLKRQPEGLEEVYSRGEYEDYDKKCYGTEEAVPASHYVNPEGQCDECGRWAELFSFGSDWLCDTCLNSEEEED